MLTSTQEYRIIQYLLHKRLSLDIVSEVFDHMRAQTLQRMQDDDAEFDQAWNATKESWIGELQTTYNILYSLDDITLLMKELKKRQNRFVVMRALPAALVLAVVHLTLLSWVPVDFVQHFTIIFGLFWLSFTLYCVHFANGVRKFRKIFPNNLIILQQEWIVAPVAGLGLLGWITNIESWAKLHRALQNPEFSIDHGDYRIIFTLSVLTLFYFIVWSFMLVRRRAKTSIRTAKDIINRKLVFESV